jgi:hypothetical protein
MGQGNGGEQVKDPHIHVEKTTAPGFGNAAMRDLLTAATGLTADLPKTVGTGCGRRRPIAMTSTVPEHVTCLACREWARADRLQWAELAEALLADMADNPAFAVKVKLTPGQLADQAREHREIAARFATVL